MINADEFLKNKYKEMRQRYVKNNEAFYINPSIAWIEPFKIADNLYYVGDKRVCVHLIDAGEGLVLIDSGYPHTLHLLIDSIWRAGFDPRDVKWIIHTHAHYDHFGASEEFRRLYGTKLAVSRVDAEAVREVPQRAFSLPESFPYAKTPDFDYEIEDGEVFEFGNVKIRCVLTPGHTDGVMSLFFEVEYNGETHLAGLLGGAGLSALSLPYLYGNKRSKDTPQKMLEAIDNIWDEPVTVHLGNHPSNNKTLQKRERQLIEGGNPFVDFDSWKWFLTELRKNLIKIIDENEKLEKQFSEG